MITEKIVYFPVILLIL